MMCLDFHDLQIWAGILLGVSITLAIVVGYQEFMRRRR